MASKDYYSILGVNKEATEADIKKAFHKLAHKYHPDKKDGDEAKFKEVNEAYQILSDRKRRAEYDAYGQSFGQQGGGAGPDFSGFGFDFGGANGEPFQFDLSDIFSQFFGGQGSGGRRTRRGRDISIDIQIPFVESIFGSERSVLITKIGSCETCQGKGAAPGSTMAKCAKCNGKGQVHETRNSLLGPFTAARECQECLGRGEVPAQKCSTCSGMGVVRKSEEIKISVPSGIQNGEMIRLTGKGEAVPGGLAGDLYVKMHVDKHTTFRRDGENLLMDLDIKLTDALLGAEYKVASLDGEIALKVPQGVSSGEILRVRGKGVPDKTARRGDLLIRVIIKNPSKLSRRAHDLVEKLREEGI